MAEKQIFSEEVAEATTRFEFEYVTSGVSLLDGDGIVVHVVNDSDVPEKVRVVIYKNSGAGAITVSESGAVLPSTWIWGLGFTVLTTGSGEYWLRIQVTSEFLVPKASFERHDGSVWIPVVSYRPGDFAVFDLRPVRRRIW
jgi:hypothetical protein